MVCDNDNMKESKKQVSGFINETHKEEIHEVFGKEIAEKVAITNGKTFLDILRESGAFDLTSKSK